MLGSTRSLVHRCVAGERPAWRELHRRYQPMTLTFLRRMGVPPADLADACQDVFVQVFRYLARFEERADFKTWIYKLCLSVAGRLRRRAKLAARVRTAFGWLLRAGSGEEVAVPGLTWSEADAERRVQAALARMKPIHREVFVLYELEGLSGAEVAEVTGLPFATVRRRLHNARHEFEAAVAESGEGTP